MIFFGKNGQTLGAMGQNEESGNIYKYTCTCKYTASHYAGKQYDLNSYTTTKYRHTDTTLTCKH